MSLHTRNTWRPDRHLVSQPVLIELLSCDMGGDEVLGD